MNTNDFNVMNLDHSTTIPWNGWNTMEAAVISLLENRANFPHQVWGLQDKYGWAISEKDINKVITNMKQQYNKQSKLTQTKKTGQFQKLTCFNGKIKQIKDDTK